MADSNRIFVFTSISLLLLAGCSHKETKVEAKPDQAKSNPLEIKVSPSLLGQLKVGEPSWSAVADSLHVAGRIEADGTRLARIGSPVKGRITNLAVMEGQHVTRGEVLATLYSTDLSDAQFAFIKAISQQQLSQRAADRGKQLVEADVIGSAELQRRQAEVLQANAEVSALREQLAALGMSDAAIRELETTRKLNSTYLILATISGTVLERSVTIGQLVQPAEVAFLVTDLSNVWLVADIPEQNSGNVNIGKLVEAEVPAFPEEKIQGRLSFVSATVNPETRTVRVRMNLPNPKGRFKPAMLATVTLEDQAQRERVLPATAIVRENDQDHVFVQITPDKFLLRPVNLGGEYGDKRALVSGVNPGEKVVLDGAFHLNNERKRAAVEGGS
jgi:cobalt-zinc-cadmium efflux system membrane fusion protein